MLSRITPFPLPSWCEVLKKSNNRNTKTEQKINGSKTKQKYMYMNFKKTPLLYRKKNVRKGFNLVLTSLVGEAEGEIWGQFNRTFTSVFYKYSYCFETLEKWFHMKIILAKVLLVLQWKYLFEQQNWILSEE